MPRTRCSRQMFPARPVQEPCQLDSWRGSRQDSRTQKAPQKRKGPPPDNAGRAFDINPGGDLRSRAVTRAVSSALQGLTSVFGMGTGVTLAVRPPGNLKFETHNPILEAHISFTRASNFEYRVSMINRRKQADHKFHLKVMQCGKDCLTFHASAHPFG